MKFNFSKLIEKNERDADGVLFSSLDVIDGTVREVRTIMPDASIRVEYRRWEPTKRMKRLFAGEWATCDAMTRKGTPCKRRPISGRRRCRNHGGLSTGAKTPEGRARIAESNRSRAEIKRANLNNSHQAASTPKP